MRRRLTFIGVTTSQSSVVRIFPRWRELLGLGADAEIIGWDLELDAPAPVYRHAIARLSNDPEIVGALVTTHKLGIMRSARDQFDELDPNALLLEEVSCIASRGGRLLGWAKDPVTAGGALEEMLADDHFARTGAEVLVMGAGGAGAAIAVYLAAQRADTPPRIIVTDLNGGRLDHLRTIATRLGEPAALELVLAGEGVHERLLAGLPPQSLVVNATGMGKDRPGSPITDSTVLPERAIAWELNYRGKLDFHRQAAAQQESRGLVVQDGWRYFIRGWAAVIEEVFERPIGQHDLDMLARQAEAIRISSTPPSAPSRSKRHRQPASRWSRKDR